MSAENPPEYELVERAIAGDESALNLVLTESEGRLREYVTRRIPRDLRGVLDADDIIQEARLDIVRRINTFKQRDPSAFYRWVATIALNRLRDFIKRQRSAKRGGEVGTVGAHQALHDSTFALFDKLAGDVSTPSRRVARRDAVRAMRSALAELPEDYRQAVWLIYIEQRSVAEVAVKMGRTDRAIHALCRRGLDQLKKKLRGASPFISSAGPE